MKSENKKVTVLMPVFNGERYLIEAMDSIISQTYKNFEFLIIDDGSTDNSVKIINEYDDSRIRLIHNTENIGLIETLNKGISLATGTYIARMDCDDISLPERLEKQVRYMEQHPDIGVCGTALKLIDQNVEWHFAMDHDFLKCKLLFTNNIAHPTVMIRKKVLENIKYEKYEHAEDYHLWVTLSDKTKLANLPEVLLKYRQHPNQISNKFYRKQQATASRIMLKQINKLNITPTDLEFSIHLRLLSNKKVQSSDMAKQWCKKILEKNSEIKIYNQDVLKPFLENIVQRKLNLDT
jgi:glycosyltransferase involved in cell wall biosynthesis